MSRGKAICFICLSSSVKTKIAIYHITGNFRGVLHKVAGCQVHLPAREVPLHLPDMHIIESVDSISRDGPDMHQMLKK